MELWSANSMEYSEYYSSYELPEQEQEFYENEYDYPSYSSNEIDYMYPDDLNRLADYESDDILPI